MKHHGERWGSTKILQNYLQKYGATQYVVTRSRIVLTIPGAMHYDANEMSSKHRSTSYGNWYAANAVKNYKQIVAVSQRERNVEKLLK